MGAAVGLLLLSVVLSACAGGGVPPAKNWPTLTVADGSVYVTSLQSAQVYVLDAETGAQGTLLVPQSLPQGTSYWSPVALGGDLAYVGVAVPAAKVYGLRAFDPKTGQEKWRAPAEDSILGAPVYADGAVYYGASDGQVYAVDAATGQVKPGWPFRTEEAVWGAPLVANGKVYIASMDHRLYCLDAETGTPAWEAPFETGGAMAAQPVLDASGRVLYVGDFDGRVYAVETSSGLALSGFDSQTFRAGNWIWAEVLLTSDRLYATALDGRLYALDPATGKELATYVPFPLDTTKPDGKGDPLRAAPVQSGDSILVASESGRIALVDPATGNVLREWAWNSGIPPAGIMTTPVVSGDSSYTVLLNGQVLATASDLSVQRWPLAPAVTQ
jgi:outer membrane protein assembly factor BamB